MSVVLTNEQEYILDRLVSWISNTRNNKRSTYLSVGGYAGTGKTFLIAQLKKYIKDKFGYSVSFCSFTGKATLVLKQKLEEHDALDKYDFCGTIHSLIYIPIVTTDKKTKREIISGWKKRKTIDKYDLIIIDEASMISKDMLDDLLTFNIPIIFFGDHAQLPPVSGSFNLMAKPDYKMEEIRRQTLDNPIIWLSKFVRQNGYIPEGIHGKSVFKLRYDNKKVKDLYENIEWSEKDLIGLCGFNKTRSSLNNRIRDKMKFSKDILVYPGEKVICLLNNKETNIMNGQIGYVLWVDKVTKNIYEITIDFDNMNKSYSNLCNVKYFGKTRYNDKQLSLTNQEMDRAKKESNLKSIDAFDYGYFISVHKAQGSEWDRVVLLEERSSYWDDDYYRRWLYTAVTRAKEKLFVLV